MSVRQIIEPQVAALAAQNRSDKDLEKLNKTIKVMKSSKEDKFEISKQDIIFHNVISQASNNPLIPIVVEPIFHVLSKFHPPIFYDQQVADIALEYHIKLYDAIKDQKSDVAFSVMSQHLKLTETHNLRLYSSKDN